MRHGSTRRRRAGAGSSAPSIIASTKLVGWHTAKIGDRWAALEPLRQGVRHVFGGLAKDVARGLRIRCDCGPQYMADAWINEVKWLGMTITPSYVGEPECNGVIKRFLRTLKEQWLYLHRFQNLAEARRKSDPVFLDTVLAVSTMTATQEAGHAREAAEGYDAGN